MVATVLLIVAAIVVGVLVATFSRETEKRVEGKIIDMGNVVECEDIGIGLVIDTKSGNPSIEIKNTGTLGIDKIIKRIYLKGGGITSDTISGIDKDNRLLPGSDIGVDISADSEVVKVEFIPIIITEDNKEIGCERKIVTWEK